MTAGFSSRVCFPVVVSGFTSLKTPLEWVHFEPHLEVFCESPTASGCFDFGGSWPKPWGETPRSRQVEPAAGWEQKEKVPTRSGAEGATRTTGTGGGLVCRSRRGAQEFVSGDLFCFRCKLAHLPRSDHKQLSGRWLALMQCRPTRARIWNAVCVCVRGLAGWHRREDRRLHTPVRRVTHAGLCVAGQEVWELGSNP